MGWVGWVSGQAAAGPSASPGRRSTSSVKAVGPHHVEVMLRREGFRHETAPVDFDILPAEAVRVAKCQPNRGHGGQLGNREGRDAHPQPLRQAGLTEDGYGLPQSPRVQLIPGQDSRLGLLPHRLVDGSGEPPTAPAGKQQIVFPQTSLIDPLTQKPNELWLEGNLPR